MSGMTIQDVRDTCYEQQQEAKADPGAKDWNEAQDWIILGMQIAVGSSNRGMCFYCKGCDHPLCFYQGMTTDIYFQFRI